MGLAVFVIILLVEGLFVGALARLLVPGPDPMGLGLTIFVGLFGTFTAGLFSWYVLHRHGWGLLIAVAFSMALVVLLRYSRGTTMGGHPRSGRRS